MNPQVTQWAFHSFIILLHMNFAWNAWIIFLSVRHDSHRSVATEQQCLAITQSAHIQVPVTGGGKSLSHGRTRPCSGRTVIHSHEGVAQCSHPVAQWSRLIIRGILACIPLMLPSLGALLKCYTQAVQPSRLWSFKGAKKYDGSPPFGNSLPVSHLCTLYTPCRELCTSCSY